VGVHVLLGLHLLLKGGTVLDTDSNNTGARM
jgi:hypothetical protein